ncbi:hypothetical protein VNO77_08247 [Canavalia gladiata]|uniref:Uncharacterized protein n=1 Tax=Canavalia gladiata TaxID=3824 RepID=A0AAN9M937_CANGL
MGLGIFPKKLGIIFRKERKRSGEEAWITPLSLARIGHGGLRQFTAAAEETTTKQPSCMQHWAQGRRRGEGRKAGLASVAKQRIRG